MDTQFITFWHLYAPLKQFANRYRACEQLWAAKDESTREGIIRTLHKERLERSPPPHLKNPYFYLTDWEPPKPHWLTPIETGHALRNGTHLAVCLNPDTQRFGTVTRTEAEEHHLQIHHFM